jgi:hypothetical protein
MHYGTPGDRFDVEAQDFLDKLPRCMGRVFILILLLLILVALCSCGGGIDLTNPSPAVTDAEQHQVDAVKAMSDIAGQKVTGSITDTEYWVDYQGERLQAYGWYNGGIGQGARGVAYFNRTLVNRCDYACHNWAAAHEVCHSITGFGHDDRHAFCTQVLNSGQSPWVQR